MEVDEIEAYIAKHRDGIPSIDPSFWLSGKYTRQETNPVYTVFPIGSLATEWLYRYCQEDPKEFTKCMITFSCLPDESPRSRIVRIVTIYEKFFATHGDVMAFSNVASDEPLYISPEVRDEMSEYALSLPYMIDVFKAKAQKDLTVSGHLYDSMQSFIADRVGFEPSIFTFIQLFPKIAAEVYKNIEYNVDGSVKNFEIVAPSEEFTAINDQYQLV